MGRKMRAVSILLFTLLCPTILGQSQITSVDANAELNQRLATKNQYRKERLVEQTVRECDWHSCNRGDSECLRCSNVKKTVPQTYTAFLKLAGPATGIVKGDVFVEPKFSVLPDQFHLHPLDVVNCSPDQPQSLTKTLAVTLQTTTSFQVTRSVTNTTTISGNVTYKFSDLGSASLTITGTKTVNFGTSETQTTSNTLNQTEQVTLTAPPLTRSQAILRVIEGGAQAPFRATIVLDGPVDANLDGIRTASQVLSESERTINVEGVLKVTSASQSQVIRKDSKVTAEFCVAKPAVQMTELTQSVLSAGSLVTGLDTALILGKSAKEERVSPSWAKITPQRVEGSTRAALSSRRRLPRLAGFFPFDLPLTSGTPGNVCYIGPCNIPPDGHRLVCKYDEDGACLDCMDARDPVCDTPPRGDPFFRQQ